MGGSRFIATRDMPCLGSSDKYIRTYFRSILWKTRAAVPLFRISFLACTSYSILFYYLKSLEFRIFLRYWQGKKGTIRGTNRDRLYLLMGSNRLD